MTLMRWLGSWGGWSIVMLVALSIHLSGHVAYQAGARSAEVMARQTPPQLFVWRAIDEMKKVKQ